MHERQLQDLEASWQSLWAQAGAHPGPALFQTLINAWSETQRRYHTLQHLGECLANFETLAHLPQHPIDVGLALWFHDAIYDLGRQDNEARSAEWAKKEILAAGMPQEMANRVADLIMATCHNAVPQGIDAEVLAEVLVDIDLWILGAPTSRFDEYEQQVREEYGHIPDVMFRSGRLAILLQFLTRPCLFSTPEFLDRYEAQARSNLNRSIQRLNAESHP